MGVAVFHQLSLVKRKFEFLITSTCYKILSFLQIFLNHSEDKEPFLAYILKNVCIKVYGDLLKAILDLGR